MANLLLQLALLFVLNMLTKEEMLTAIQAAEDGPTDADLIDAPTLDFWRIEMWNDHFRIYGECSDHPEIDDRYVTTAPLLALNSSGGWARSRTRWYKIGPNFYSPEPEKKTAQYLCEVERALNLQRQQVRAGLEMSS